MEGSSARAPCLNGTTVRPHAGKKRPKGFTHCLRQKRPRQTTEYGTMSDNHGAVPCMRAQTRHRATKNGPQRCPMAAHKTASAAGASLHAFYSIPLWFAIQMRVSGDYTVKIQECKVKATGDLSMRPSGTHFYKFYMNLPKYMSNALGLGRRRQDVHISDRRRCLRAFKEVARRQRHSRDIERERDEAVQRKGSTP